MIDWTLRATPHLIQISARSVQGQPRAYLLNNSLIQLTSALVFEKFSLLFFLGNCAKSPCSAVVSSYKIGSQSLKSQNSL
jgi:hypothetical protein